MRRQEKLNITAAIHTQMPRMRMIDGMHNIKKQEISVFKTGKTIFQEAENEC
jgi:hypothetical protein